MHVEAVDSSSDGEQRRDSSEISANEETVRHLQMTVEEVGMTFRTIMAATTMAMCYNTYLFTLLIPPAILSFINADLGPDPRYTWITISWNLGVPFILMIGSIVSATGQSIGQMIAGGALFGCGSGFLEMAFGAVQEIVPSKYRHAHNLAMLITFYHPPTWKEKRAEHGKSAKQLIREFDWLGLFFFLAGCTLFIVGVSWGGSMAPWVSATVLCPIIIATLWLRLSQLVYASDEISKGLFAEVLPLGTIIGGIIVAFSKVIGHQRWVIMFAVALQTACVGAMSTSTVDNPGKSIILTVIISTCTSVNLLNGMVLVGFGIVYQEDIGTAAGLAGTSRLLAGAVTTAIFQIATITRLIAAAKAKANTAAGYAAIPGITPAIRIAASLGNKQAYLEGAHLSYLVALAFGLCVVVAAFFIPTVDRRKCTDKTVAIQKHDRKVLEEKKVGGAA
ncbi:hypothetical protein EK21DRAFT_103971 [Setomelanomma holmii]|uniref:Uncharacterized protein n=1 Tax=Setomelanomma holmii TaxID=210430 RepID=A0A9P4LHQ3_9PLEO|nr:hypothetical protein EK21DRAFT_103971 [Setomelanomma holmii]